ncbi:MAG: hypothetical protein HZA88_16550 [Verrucomicrobia bacterium]|nr:hypothetical protein [Verrucomicrobiota bacterium]
MNPKATGRLLCVCSALMIAGAGTVDAALFDTRAQIESKYGPPVQSKKAMKGSDESILYRKDSWNIQVEYIKGRAMRVAYWIDGHKLTKSEALSLIQANSENGNPWAETRSRNAIRWTRTDHRATAELQFNSGILAIASADWGVAAINQKKTDLGTVSSIEKPKPAAKPSVKLH